MSKGTEQFTTWQGLVLADGAAIMIAALMPFTPSKTGSDRGVFDFLIGDPTCLQKLLVYFAQTNFLILVIGVIIWIWVKFR